MWKTISNLYYRDWNWKLSLSFPFNAFEILKLKNKNQGIPSHLINEGADVLFILSENEEALFPIVGAHCQGEHVEAGLRTLK